jgi:hypothetical protein
MPAFTFWAVNTFGIPTPRSIPHVVGIPIAVVGLEIIGAVQMFSF